MAYIGKQPLVGNFTLLDSITATTTDTYALTKDAVAVFPQTPANCIVSLNGVIQAPTDSYTISGSDIVFDSALTGADSIDFITVLGDVLNVGTVSDGTITTAKLASGVLPTNTPAFEANRATDLSFTDNVTQKITYDTEIFDTNGYYDNATNYRFTPLIAGKYYVYASLTIQASSATTLNLAFLEIHKNGTKYRGTMNNMNANFITGLTPYVGTVIDMNGSTDYIEVYVRPTVSSGTVKSQGADNVFGAYKIIE